MSCLIRVYHGQSCFIHDQTFGWHDRGRQISDFLFHDFALLMLFHAVNFQGNRKTIIIVFALYSLNFVVCKKALVLIYMHIALGITLLSTTNL